MSESTGAALPSLTSLVALIPIVLVLVAAASSNEWPPLQRTVATLVLLAALPAGVVGILDPRVAPQEAPVTRPVAGSVLTGQAPAAAADPMADARAVAAWIDADHLPSGSVLIDSYTGFPILLASKDPHQFVITNDRDFQQALTDPAGNGVQYLLVPSPRNTVSVSSLDALTRAYPGLYAGGGGIGTLVRDFTGTDAGSGWRLYRVIAN